MMVDDKSYKASSSNFLFSFNQSKTLERRQSVILLPHSASTYAGAEKLFILLAIIFLNILARAV